MLGSIYIGMTGLSAYSKGLETISNNVSNLNTTGFKTTDITFQDIYGSESGGGLEYGNNSSASGHGVNVGDRRVDFSQGEFRQTERDLDLAIDGNGFFVLLDENREYYVRTGRFEVADDGNIVHSSSNYHLALLDEARRPVSVNIDSFRTNPPEPTTTIKFSDNLSSTASQHVINDVNVISQDGTEFVWSIRFDRVEDAPGSWTVVVTNSTGEEVGSTTLSFQNGLVEPDSRTLLIESEGNGISVELDFSTGVTNFSSGTISTLRAAEVDGHSTGTIATLTVDDEGRLVITYSNEEEQDLGSIAIVDFREPQKLDQQSNGLFRMNEKVLRDYLSAEDSRVGTIRSKVLEASNVDLGAEFGSLILIQRGFQASSQIVSVSNDMIQQLFGIRGSGG